MKEDQDSEKDKKKTRRKFINDIALLGAGGVAGATAIYAGRNFENKKQGKNIRLLTQDNKVVEVNEHDVREAKTIATELQEGGREGITNRRWVMVIDLSKCRNARKCISACQNAHDLKPEQFHINTLHMQETPETAPFYMPKPCMHCDNPPCVSVCPVDATFKRNDGIVLIDNERCIGCRFCVAACPYSARIFHWTEPKVSAEHTDKEYDIEKNVPQKKGTITKCLFSADRLRNEELPSCVSSCPNGVYYFGDENEDAVTNGTTKETVRFSELLKNNAGYTLMEELGTKPRVYYLPPKNRLFPFDSKNTPNNHEG